MSSLKIVDTYVLSSIEDNYTNKCSILRVETADVNELLVLDLKGKFK